jgi:hypothetical protein
MEVVAPTNQEARSAYTNDLAELAQMGHLTGRLPEQVNQEAARFIRQHRGSVYAAGVRHGLMERLRHQVHAKTANAKDRELYEELLRGQRAEPRPK